MTNTKSDRREPRRNVHRTFNTHLMFWAHGPGYWAVAHWGKAEASWLTVGHIEKRRSEPGHPPGWYYFGPGAPDGELAGDYVGDAARLAAKRIT